jgi:predicted nucleic acid-binding protein
MGFADALHAASAATMNISFHTFDAALAGRAEKLLGISVQMV